MTVSNILSKGVVKSTESLEEDKSTFKEPLYDASEGLTKETVPTLPEPTITAPELQFAEIDPSVTAGVELLKEQPEMVNEMLTYLKGMGIELTGVVGGNLILAQRLAKMRSALAAAKNVKDASKLGSRGLGPVGTGAFVLSELAIGGASNWANQAYLDAVLPNYREGKGVSAGEVMASAVFNVGFIVQPFEKFRKLERAAVGSWGKGRKLATLKLGDKFITGSALGLAESVLRQEYEAQVNGEEREAWDYIISAGAGGVFNTGISMLGTTGKWGKERIIEINKGAKTRLQGKAQEVNDQIRRLKESFKNILGPGEGGPTADTIKIQITQLEKQLSDINQAMDVVEDTTQTLAGVNDGMSEITKKMAAVDPVEQITTVDPRAYFSYPDDLVTFQKRRDEIVKELDDINSADISGKEGFQKVDELGKELKDVEDKISDIKKFQDENPVFWDLAPTETTPLDRELFNLPIDSPKVRREATPDEIEKGLDGGTGYIETIAEDGHIRWEEGVNPGDLVKKGQGVLVPQMLDHLEKTTKSTYAKGLIKLFKKIAETDPTLKDVPIFLTPKVKQGWNGIQVTTRKEAFEPERFIQISDTETGRTASTVLHEILHAVTLRQIHKGRLTSTMMRVPLKEGEEAILKPVADVFDTIRKRREVSRKKATTDDPSLLAIRDHDETVNLITQKREEFLKSDHPQEIKEAVDVYFEYLIQKSSQKADPSGKIHLRNVDNVSKSIFENARKKGGVLEGRDTLHIDEVLAQYPSGSFEEFFAGLSDPSFVNDLANMKASANFGKGKTLLEQFIQAIRNLFPKLKPEEQTLLEQSLNAVASLNKLKGKDITIGQEIVPSPQNSITFDDPSMIHGGKPKEPSVHPPLNVDDVRENKLKDLILRQKSLEVTPDKGTLSKDAPRLHREGAELARETDERITDLIRLLSKEPENLKYADNLLREIRFLRELNKNVKDWWNTVGARLLQSQRGDADKFEWSNKYSERASRQDEALSRLQATLEARTRGILEEDDIEIEKLFNEYLETPSVVKTERARSEKSEEFKAEQLHKAYEKKRTKLESELEGLRSRFGKIDEEAKDAGVRLKPKKDPRLKELEEKIKYYKEAEKEALNILKLERELARVADIEGRGIVGELRKETTPTPKGPVKPARSSILRKNIQESKNRMKQKLRDLDKAQKQIEDAQLQARMFRAIEDAFYKELETDTAGLFTRGWTLLKDMRRLALIDQLPSVLAGVPTGAGAVAKQFARPITRLLYNPENYSLPLRSKLALADASGALKIIVDLKYMWTEARRTFVENRSAVDRRSESLISEYSKISRLPRGEHTLVARAGASAERRTQALENSSNWLLRTLSNGQYMNILSLGVRGIQSIDSVFKRQLAKGRLWASVQKQAILEFPDNPRKAKKRAEELYESQWKDSDGLPVLKDTTDFDDEINQIREELFFAAHGDLEDYHFTIGDQVVEWLKKGINDGGFLGNTLEAFMPYVGVPIRSIYRGAKLATTPFQVALQGGFSKVPGLRGRINPYSRKIKELDRLIEGEYTIIRMSEEGSEVAEDASNRIKDLKTRKLKVEQRRIKHNEDLLTDSMVASSLYAFGGMAALYYGGTGSLAWMTEEQLKNNKLESFRIFGMDYSAALPWSFPLAIAADIASWARIRREERDTKQIILTKDQDLEFVISSSFKQLVKSLPLTQGIKTAEQIAQLEGEATKNGISSLLSSYVPIPAQVRKITETITQRGVVDLRGGSYWDRIAYKVLNYGVDNLKTDRLGEDLPNTSNFATQNIMRQLPRDELIRTEFDKIVATDVHGNLTGKPVSLKTGIVMTEWVNDEGTTLSYAYDQKLKTNKIKIKASLKLPKSMTGKTFTIKNAVDALIKTREWKVKFQKGFQEDDETGRLINEGLIQLNTLLNFYYRETKVRLLKDSKFLNEFVNEEGESLFTVLQKRGKLGLPIGKPTSPLELLTP